MFKKRIEAATVRLTEKGGCGVLVEGGLIFTAAHCLDLATNGDVALGEYQVQRIETANGKELLAELQFADLATDLAVLGAPDDNAFFEESESFREFCDVTAGAKICNWNPKSSKNYEVHILTHRREWIAGTTECVKPEATRIIVATNERIESGTSGSAVVAATGELIGVVSLSIDDTKPFQTVCPVACLSLPVWLQRRLEFKTPD